MKKALVWHLQTAWKRHGESANEVDIVNYHWASSPPCQGAGSQSQAHGFADHPITSHGWTTENSQGLIEQVMTKGWSWVMGRERGICTSSCLPMELHTVLATAAPWLPLHQAKKSQHRPRCHIRTHRFLVVTHSAPGHSRKLVMQYHTDTAPCGQTSGNTDYSKGWITIQALTEYLWLPKHFVSTNATSVTRRQINICPHYTGRNWDTERLCDLFYTAKVNSRARKTMTDR